MTQKTKTKPSATPAKNRSTLWWILGGAVGFALIVLLAISIAGEEGIDEGVGFGAPTVEGDPLPVRSGTGQDVAIGMTAPTVEGADWEGNPVSIAPGETSKLIVFLAHWCPHCQNEVPVVQDWVDAGNLPDNVELIAVATATDPRLTNWPPQDWLIEEGWTAPVIMDDEIGTVAASYGMAGTPYWVALDPENRVIQRVSGEMGVAGLQALSLLAAAAAGG